MKRCLLVAIVLTLCLPVSSSAVVLSFSPSASPITVGNTLSVDIVVSGLGSSGGPSLGAFGIGITFDASILNYTGVTYGSFLGDTDPLAFETDILTTVGSGSVFLDEISFLSSIELDLLQPSSFTLATLTFDALNVGTSSLFFNFADLSDASFPANSLQTKFANTPILVTSPNTQGVPEPPIAWHWLIGLLYFIFVEKRNLRISLS